MAGDTPQVEAAASTADQTEKRRNLARQMIQTATQLMAAVNAGYDQSNEYSSAQLVFVDTDFQGQPGLSHVDATMMTNAIAQFINVHDTFHSGSIDNVFNAIKQ